MSTSRNSKRIYSTAELTKHITASDTILDLEEYSRYFLSSALTAAHPVIDIQSYATTNPAFYRYVGVLNINTTHANKVKLITEMMAEDDLNTEDKPDNYDELFFNFFKAPLIPLELLKLFFDAGLLKNCPHLLNKLFIEAIMAHNAGGPLFAYIKFFIERGADANYRDENLTVNPLQLTALHFALLNDKNDIIFLMLLSKDIGIDFALQDGEGRTVLVLAAKKRKISILLMMLNYPAARASVHITDYENRNVLNYAYILGMPEVVIALKNCNNARLVDDHFVEADVKEITRVLNSVSTDENRHYCAETNYFQLTPAMPMGMPVADQLAAGLVISKFNEAGGVITGEMCENEKTMVTILCCAINANFVKQFRDQVRASKTYQVPEDVLALWDIENGLLNEMAKNPQTILQASMVGQKAFTKKITSTVSVAVPQTFFNQTTATIIAVEAKEPESNKRLCTRVPGQAS